MHIYHHNLKVVPGPGGMHCACCNMYHKGRSQKSTKQRINRANRRKYAQELSKEIHNV